MKSNDSEIRIKFITYVFVFCVVFFSSDTTLFGTNINTQFVSIGYIAEAILILLLFFLIVVNNNYLIVINKKLVILLLVFVGCIIVSSLFNHDYRGGYVILVFVSLLGFIVSNIIPIRVFARAFADVFKVIAVFSIIGKIITDIFPDIRKMGFVVLRSTGQKFNHFVLYARSIEEIGGNRNYSIFREPGDFQIFLIISIIISIVLFEKKRKNKEIIGIALLIVATLMTKSTTAYIALVLVFLFLIVKSNFKISKTGGGFVCLAILIILITCVFVRYAYMDVLLDSLKQILFEKFDSTSSSYISSVSRRASFFVNLKIWIMNPIFGMGITDKDMLFGNLQYLMYGYGENCDTNSIMGAFSQFGIGIGMFVVTAICGLSRAAGKRRSEKILVFIIIVALLSTEYLVYSVIFNIWIWYGINVIFNCSKRIKHEGRILYERNQ